MTNKSEKETNPKLSLQEKISRVGKLGEINILHMSNLWFGDERSERILKLAELAIRFKNENLPFLIILASSHHTNNSFPEVYHDLQRLSTNATNKLIELGIESSNIIDHREIYALARTNGLPMIERTFYNTYDEARGVSLILHEITRLQFKFLPVITIITRPIQLPRTIDHFKNFEIKLNPVIVIHEKSQHKFLMEVILRCITKLYPKIWEPENYLGCQTRIQRMPKEISGIFYK